MKIVYPIKTFVLAGGITIRPKNVAYVPIQNFTYEHQRTNGPVNAHLRSAVYTNVIENSPSLGADEALGPFFFFSE